MTAGEQALADMIAPLVADVCPSFAPRRPRYCAFGDTKTLAQDGQFHPIRPQGANLSHGVFGEFRVVYIASAQNQFRVQPFTVTITTRESFGVQSCGVAISARKGFGMQSGAVSLAGSQPPLDFGVQLVLSVRAEEQMIRADTSPVVAGMADEEAIGDRPVCQLPRYPVCAVRLAGDVEHAIAGRFEDGGLPEPTAIGSLNLRPEPFIDRVPSVDTGHVKAASGSEMLLTHPGRRRPAKGSRVEYLGQTRVRQQVHCSTGDAMTPGEQALADFVMPLWMLAVGVWLHGFAALVRVIARWSGRDV